MWWLEVPDVEPVTYSLSGDTFWAEAPDIIIRLAMCVSCLADFYRASGLRRTRTGNITSL